MAKIKQIIVLKQQYVLITGNKNPMIYFLTKKKHNQDIQDSKDIIEDDIILMMKYRYLEELTNNLAFVCDHIKNQGKVLD